MVLMAFLRLGTPTLQPTFPLSFCSNLRLAVLFTCTQMGEWCMVRRGPPWEPCGAGGFFSQFGGSKAEDAKEAVSSAAGSAADSAKSAATDAAKSAASSALVDAAPPAVKDAAGAVDNTTSAVNDFINQFK